MSKAPNQRSDQQQSKSKADACKKLQQQQA
jgi:hypothetical protein